MVACHIVVVCGSIGFHKVVHMVSFGHYGCIMWARVACGCKWLQMVHAIYVHVICFFIVFIYGSI